MRKVVTYLAFTIVVTAAGAVIWAAATLSLIH